MVKKHPNANGYRKVRDYRGVKKRREASNYRKVRDYRRVKSTARYN